MVHCVSHSVLLLFFVFVFSFAFFCFRHNERRAFIAVIFSKCERPFLIDCSNVCLFGCIYFSFLCFYYTWKFFSWQTNAFRQVDICISCFQTKTENLFWLFTTFCCYFSFKIYFRLISSYYFFFFLFSIILLSRNLLCCL